MAFRGTFDYSLDAKNRLTVPAKFRASLTETVVLAKGTERCVAIWTPAEFDAYVTSTRADLHPLSKQAEKLNRYFSANSFDTEIDSAGRVMLAPGLIEHAGLTKEVTVNGAGNRLEIWDREAWATYNEALFGDIDDISDLLGGQNAS